MAGPTMPVLDWQPCDGGFQCATAKVPLNYGRRPGTGRQYVPPARPRTSRSRCRNGTAHRVTTSGACHLRRQSMLVRDPPPAAIPASGSGPACLLLSLMTLASGTFIAWRCVNAGQQAPAILAMAMASLLASPISWTHHWIWVLLIPALMPRHGTSGIPRPVRIMLWGLLALTVAAPYW